jgi:hypothetical protein
VVAMLLGSAPPPTPEIAAMDQVVPADEGPTEAVELRIDDAEPGLVPPPADELRGLSPWSPAPASEPERERTAPEPEAEPVPAPPAPEDDGLDEHAAGAADPDRSDRGADREVTDRAAEAGDDERRGREGRDGDETG